MGAALEVVVGAGGGWVGPMSESLPVHLLEDKSLSSWTHCLQFMLPGGESLGLNQTHASADSYLVDSGSPCVPGLPVLWGHLQHSGSCQTS